MSSLPFSNWLNENISEERKTTNIQWDSRTVFLEENKPDYSMRTGVDNIDQGLVVINFEQPGKTTTYFRGERGFGDRCDFLVLEETADEYIAYFIELENRVPHEHAASQLRWSVPYLKYILKVFLEDIWKDRSKKRLRMRFFMIGNHDNSFLNRGGMRTGTVSRFIKWDDHARFDIYFRVYAGARIDFREFRRVSHS